MKKELENYFEFVEKNHCTEILSDFEKMQFKEWKQRKLNQRCERKMKELDLLDIKKELMEKIEELESDPIEKIEDDDSDLIKSYKQGRNNGIIMGILKAIEIICEYEKTLDKE